MYLVITQQETSKDAINYFVTPNTSVEAETHKPISRYESFDPHSKTYERRGIRVTVKRYKVCQ
jgi:hypothetical protein